MRIDQYVCDVCGAKKGEVNHWFMAFRVPGPRWTIVPWGLPKRDEQAEEIHICGIECATKALARAMDEAKLED